LLSYSLMLFHRLFFINSPTNFVPSVEIMVP
jgi:hypothetical protein